MYTKQLAAGRLMAITQSGDICKVVKRKEQCDATKARAQYFLRRISTATWGVVDTEEQAALRHDATLFIQSAEVWDNPGLLTDVLRVRLNSYH